MFLCVWPLPQFLTQSCPSNTPCLRMSRKFSLRNRYWTHLPLHCFMPAPLPLLLYLAVLQMCHDYFQKFHSGFFLSSSSDSFRDSLWNFFHDSTFIPPRILLRNGIENPPRFFSGIRTGIPLGNFARDFFPGTLVDYSRDFLHHSFQNSFFMDTS